MTGPTTAIGGPRTRQEIAQRRAELRGQRRLVNEEASRRALEKVINKIWRERFEQGDRDKLRLCAEFCEHLRIPIPSWVTEAAARDAAEQKQLVSRGAERRRAMRQANNDAAVVRVRARTKAVALLADPELATVVHAGETEMARREAAAAATKHSYTEIVAEKRRVFQAFADECKRARGLRSLRSFHDVCDKAKNRLDPPNSISHVKDVLKKMGITPETWRNIPLDWEHLTGT